MQHCGAPLHVEMELGHSPHMVSGQPDLRGHAVVELSSAAAVGCGHGELMSCTDPQEGLRSLSHHASSRLLTTAAMQQSASCTYMLWLQVTVLKNLTNLFVIAGDIIVFGRRYNLGERDLQAYHPCVLVMHYHIAFYHAAQNLKLMACPSGQQACGPRWC